VDCSRMRTSTQRPPFHPTQNFPIRYCEPSQTHISNSCLSFDQAKGLAMPEDVERVGEPLFAADGGVGKLEGR
jgi:hypothetical protein